MAGDQCSSSAAQFTALRNCSSSASSACMSWFSRPGGSADDGFAIPFTSALRRTGDREAGGGARAPQAAARAASLAAPPARAVAALSWLSSRHRPVVRACSANGAGRIRRRAGSVRRCGTWTTIQGSSGPDAGAGVTHAGESTGQTLGWRLARWLFWSRASFAAADLPAPVTPHCRRAV
jgi:hypothetical protein